MVYINRRNFLGGSSAFTLGAGMLGLGLGAGSKAWGADTSGNKSLVCIQFFGGMDQSDTVLPYDQASWDELRNARSGLFDSYDVDGGNSSRNRENLLQLNPTNSASLGGREFALPPALGKVHQLFEDGDLAILGNVGPLVAAVTRDEMERGVANLPRRLFSHNSQQATWLTLKPFNYDTGWGGQFADAAMTGLSDDVAKFAAMSPSSNGIFLVGDRVRPMLISQEDVAEPSLLQSATALGSTDSAEITREKLNSFFERSSTTTNNLFMQDTAEMDGMGTANAKLINSARENIANFTTSFPNTALGRGLFAVAQSLSIQSNLNVPRQVYHVGMGGFDTHSRQVIRMARLHGQIDAAMSAFASALKEIDRWDDTVTFTTSEFGRTVTDNGDGTDHGWGGHQFIMGGSVKGQQIYGELPAAELTSQLYTPTRGRLIPTTSVEQYAATLGSWFGLNSSELGAALPNLSEFDNQDLGFL